MDSEDHLYFEKDTHLKEKSDLVLKPDHFQQWEQIYQRIKTWRTIRTTNGLGETCFWIKPCSGLGGNENC